MINTILHIPMSCLVKLDLVWGSHKSMQMDLHSNFVYVTVDLTTSKNMNLETIRNCVHHMPSCM